MRVEFIEKLDIEMGELMAECINRLDWAQKRAARGHYTPDYENLESLVQEGLEFLYDIEPYKYYNASEVIALIAKNLLLWCLEYNFTEEHDRLEKMY